MPDFRPREVRGFTLIEIIAVIAIMSVIAGLLIVAATGAHKKADRDAAEAGVQLIAGRIEAFQTERGQLPPDPNFDSSLTPEQNLTTEVEIYETLEEWGFDVPEEKRVDPWGNPYVIVLGRDYGKEFPIRSGGLCYSDPQLPYRRMGNPSDDPAIKQMYYLATEDQPKEIHDGDPVTEPAYNDQPEGFQVISAGPDGWLHRNRWHVGDAAHGEVNADNITNW